MRTQIQEAPFDIHEHPHLLYYIEGGEATTAPKIIAYLLQTLWVGLTRISV